MDTAEPCAGEVLWVGPRPLRRSHQCGEHALTSTDLVMACLCDDGEPERDAGGGGGGYGLFRDGREANGMPHPGNGVGNGVGNGAGSRSADMSHIDGSSGSRRAGIASASVADGTSHIDGSSVGVASASTGGHSVPSFEPGAVCVYSIKLGTGKLKWEALVAASDEGDGLPPGSMEYMQEPLVLADSVVVVLRRRVVAVQRTLLAASAGGEDGRRRAGDGRVHGAVSDVSGGNEDGLESAEEDGTGQRTQPAQSGGTDSLSKAQDGEVLWTWSAPKGMVAEAWFKVDLHTGVVLVRLSHEEAAQPMVTAPGLDAAGAGSSKVAASMLVALDPASGEELWSTALGPAWRPKRQQVWTKLLLGVQRCSVLVFFYFFSTDQHHD